MKLVCFLLFLAALACIPSASSEILFESDFSTATGFSANAYTDGGKWDFVSNDRGVPNKEIVSTAGLDFPMANAYNVICTAAAECWSQLRVTTLPVPAVGESRYYRWYFRSVQPDNLEDGGTHPIETGGSDVWALEIYNTPLFGLPAGQYAVWFYVGESTYNNQRWYIGTEQSPIPFNKHETYRFEVHVLRTGTSTMNLHIRVYDSNDVLLYDDADIHNPAGVSLASTPSLALSNPASLSTWQVGNNGIGGAAPFPFTYAYESGFCVRDDTWCGPYGGTTTPPGEAIPGDLNEDGIVNLQDLLIVIQRLGRSVAGDPRADVNTDGTINVFDVVRVARHWGNTAAPPPPPADSTPPTVSISAPSSGATVSGTATITATANDDVGVAGVQFFLDGANLGAEDTSAPYSISWNTATAANTAHTIAARVRDAAGNNATASISVTVNNTQSGSTLFFFEPFDDANYASRGWYDEGTAPVDASVFVPGSTGSMQLHMLQGAQQAVGGGSGRRLFTPSDEVYLSYWVRYSPNWVGACCSGGSHPHEMFLLTSLDGDYVGPNGAVMVSLIEHWYDYNAGTGMSPRIIARTRTSTTSMTAPVRFMNNPGPGYKGDWHFIEAYLRMNSAPGVADGIAQHWFDGEIITNRSNIVYKQQASDSTAQFRQILISPFIGPGSSVDQSAWIDNLTVASSRPGSFAPPPPAGDSTPPTVSISSPSSGATVGGTAVITATANDNIGVAGVQFLLDGANLGAEDTSAPYSISWNTASTSNAAHTITARARDAAGNNATSTGVTVTVSNSVPAGNATVLFFSDWRTAPLGNSETAINDNDKWESVVGCCADDNGEIIAAPTGFPTARVLRVESAGARNGYLAPTVWNLPVINIGETRNYRWYHAFHEPATQDTGQHPIQDGGAVSQSNWYFSTTNSGANLQPGQWGTAYYLSGNNAFGFENSAWVLGSREGQFTPLTKGAVYRHEVQVVRTGASTFRFHIWIYDANGNLLYDDDDFHSRGGATSLGENPTQNFNVVGNTATFLIGLNGIGIGGETGWPIHSSDQAAIAIVGGLPEGTPIGPYGAVAGEVAAPPPPSGGEGLLFASDFGTAIGNSATAMTDGSRWTMRGGAGGDVISAAGLDFPTANVLRVSWNDGWTFVRKTGMPIPAVGESRYYRWYMQLILPDGVADGQTHPIQDGNAGSQINWELSIRHNDDGLGNALPPGTFRAQYALSPNNGWPNYIWNGPILQKGVTYRYELRVHRVSATHFELHPRIYDSAGTLLYDFDDFENAQGTAPLTLEQTFVFNDVNNMDGLNGGQNGGSMPEVGYYGYQSAFCVRSDTWCGPYQAGEAS